MTPSKVLFYEWRYVRSVSTAVIPPHAGRLRLWPALGSPTPLKTKRIAGGEVCA
jgi:hypothetical protein